MEPSPLIQDSRPDVFQPKVVRLYETIFKDDDYDAELSEGFWQEFFLHRPDGAELKRIVESVAPDEMLLRQTRSQQLFSRAIFRVKQAMPPADETALETLTAFLDTTLSKKYTNPSSDIISVLAGLDNADATMTEFITALDMVIRNGRSLSLRRKAIRTTLSINAAGFHTAIPSYFTHRDLFPSLMRYIQDCQSSADVLPAFYLLGLLANYNKFEFQNLYRLRLDDFVNDAIIRDMITCFGETCLTLREAYIAIQDDVPESWTLGSTLNYIGLGALAPHSRPSTPVPAPDEVKVRFASLPGSEIGILLSTYDFANANKVFCFNLVTLKADQAAGISPLSAYLSLSSYLFQHAHRSTRAALYTHLSLFILHILVEDQLLMKRLSSEEIKLSVRLCRQRQPYLPIVKGDRVAAAVILDLTIDGVNHNLRRRLDVDLYILFLGVLLRILSYLSRTKTRIAYHWSELWRALLAFMRFLMTYENDVKSIYRCTEMINTLVSVLAFALSRGENFLPDPASYDDLFYKLIECGDILIKFRNTFELSSQSGSMQTLINVSSHYHSLLGNNDKGKLSKNLSPREVSRVIKQGYETLSIDANEGLDQWEKFREVNSKSLFKKIVRVVVHDAKDLEEER